MWFDLTLEARDGSRHSVRYNPHTSECEGLPLPVNPGTFAQVARVAKDKPLGKSRAPRVLKMDLHRFCSGQVFMLCGPLFEGHGRFPAEG
jgi:uncharacterized protein